MRLRRCVAAFFSNGVGLASPFVHNRFGHAYSNQARGHARRGSEHDGFLDERAGFVRKILG